MTDALKPASVPRRSDEPIKQKPAEVTVTEPNAHLPPWTLEELAENALSHRETSLAMEHVRRCAQCAAELDANRALFAALGALPAFEPSPAFADAVMARVAVPAAAAHAVARRRWLPRTRKGWMTSAVGALAPLLPLLALLGWMTGRGMSPGAFFGVAGRWVGGVAWAGVVSAAEWVVRSALFQWVVTTGAELVGGTRGLSVAGVVFAVAIPLSGWMLVRLLRTPIGGMTHAH